MEETPQIESGAIECRATAQYKPVGPVRVTGVLDLQP
jgi:hypothetical protein